MNRILDRDGCLFFIDRGIWLDMPYVLYQHNSFHISSLVVDAHDLSIIRNGVMRPLSFCHIFEEILVSVVEDYEYTYAK